MLVSSKADAEGGKWSAWVAAVVAQRGSEVDRPSSAERADDEVAQAGHHLRCGPSADLGQVAKQVRGFGWLQLWVGGGELGECQWDRG